MQSRPRNLLHQVRVIASFALLGAVAFGTVFEWAPSIIGLSALAGVHEIGAALGAVAGVIANIKRVA